MPDQTQLEAFIGSSFRSVWAIDVLKFLVENSDCSFSSNDLIAALHISNVIVSQSVSALSAAGLVKIVDDNRACWAPQSDDLAQLVYAAIDLYVTRPNRVRRLIVAQNLPGVVAFSDAFKLRKD